MRRFLTGLLGVFAAVAAEAAALPPGYAAVEYIESTSGGWQYIDTDITHRANTRIECSVNVASQQGKRRPAVFGSFYGGYQSMAFAFYPKFEGADTPALCRTGREQTGVTGSFPYDERVDLVCEGRQASWRKHGADSDCGSISIANATVDDGEFVMNIFVVNDQDTRPDNSWCVMKLYSFRIFEGETLERDFVPCIEMSSRKAGLYDTVHDKFYGNAGGGSRNFQAGPEKEKEKRLPSGYERVDYIESTKGGGQYIDTEYEPNFNTRIEADFHSQWRTGEWTAFFGVTGNDEAKDGVLLRYFNDAEINGWFYNDDYRDARARKFENTRIQAELRKGSMTLNGEEIKIPTNEKNKPYKGSLYLFCENCQKEKGAWRHQAMKLYSFRVYEGEELKRNFVPCIEASTGRAGLYDTAFDKFYGNAGKGADFVTGLLPAGYERVNYIESTKGGKQYIDTEYVPTFNTRIVADFNPLAKTGSWEVFFGATGKDDPTSGILLRYDDGTNINGWFYSSNTDWKEALVENFANKRITAELKKKEMTVSDGNTSMSKPIATDTGKSLYQGSIFIFGGNNGDTTASEKPWRPHAMRLYSFKIYEGDELKRNFVPCVETGTGEAGLWDAVGHRFYRNKGSGCFARPAMLGRELTSGAYSFAESVSSIAPATESALKIASGARVVLDIPEGVTVALRGGVAQGRVGAGAGIEVPLNAELSITGTGMLIAIGGDAANGSDGGAATEGWVNTRSVEEDRWLGTNYNRQGAPRGDMALYFNNGSGGRGGDGGGGAGAGIGGRGGNGGTGGAGAASQTRDWSSNNNFPAPGSPGFAGMRGGNGGEPGRIEIADAITKNIRSGYAGTSGGAGGLGVSMSFAWYANYFGAWSGGGGGGGGAGGKGASVGAGGPGGGGGGGGGSGAFDWFSDINRFISHNQYGAGGMGGFGATGRATENGSSGTNAYGEPIVIRGNTYRTGDGDSKLTNWQHPGGPGVGGAAGVASLPDGYEFVNYIESTPNGRQYIDTNYRANANTRVVMDAYVFPRKEQADTWGVLFGSRTYGDPWTTKSFSFQMADGVPGIDSCRFAYNGQFQSDGNKPFSYGERITLVCDGQHVEWTGSKAGSVAFTASPLDQSKSTLYIFGDNSVGNDGEKRDGAYNPSIMKLYSFTICEGDALKLDFVPCVETASGRVGLYETVNGKFYPNAGKGAGFNTGRIRMPYWDPVTKSERSVLCEEVTKDTAVFEDGKWYAVMNPVERGKITVQGSVHLILCDGATLTVKGSDNQAGVEVTGANALYIYGQAGGTGALVATGGQWGAGIGGGQKCAGGTVTINGGMVTAQDGECGAGIGGGYQGAGGTVTINGGMVTASSSGAGAGIGGGFDGAGGIVTINGGTVSATCRGNGSGAGIGGGIYGGCGTVTINGGTVTACAGKDGAGIGGGLWEAGGTVTINGGTVVAKGGSQSGAGIGGGNLGRGATVAINGGTVTAEGCGRIVDIGADDDRGQGTLEINGGSVKANRVGPRPVNGTGDVLQRVVAPTSGFENPADGLKIVGLPVYYNTAGIHSVEDAIYLWLPSSRSQDGDVFSVNDGQYTRYYFVLVADNLVTLIPLTAGFWVNGRDVADTFGEGWTYDVESGLLTLNKQMNYVIEGYASNDLVKVVVAANATVALSNAVISVSSAPPITVNNNFTLKLSAVGDSASCLLAGNQPAIQGGATFVEGGSICLWSDSKVPVDCDNGKFSVAPSEIMRVGVDVNKLWYVENYEKNDMDRILLVGPRCHLGVPSIDHAAVTISNQTQKIEGKPDGQGVAVYDLMLGDVASVRVTPDAGYVLRGPLAERCIEIDGDRTLTPSELPIALKALKTDYRAVTVGETGVVSRTESVVAVLFDEAVDHLDHIGTVSDLVGTAGEDWYVVTGRVACGTICIVDTTLNLILGLGAELELSGNDGEPGFGVMSNGVLNIYGQPTGSGTLVAYGGPYAAGIGGGGAEVMEDAPGADAGWITVNGGTIIAFGGDFGAGIGGGAFGAGACLMVNGGSIFAYGGYDAEDIGGGAYGEDGVTIVNGGNVMGNSVEAKPINVKEENLYRVYVVSEAFLPTNDVPLTVVGLVGYGNADMFANEDGAICFYLPNGHYEFLVNNRKCVAEVWNGTASASVGEEEGGESDENGDSEEGEGESEEGESAEVLGIEVGEKVLVSVRGEDGRKYQLRRVTFEGGKVVVGDVIWSAIAEDDAPLMLRDDAPPAGAGFYMVEEVK